jgi:hypothetical protein
VKHGRSSIYGIIALVEAVIIALLLVLRPVVRHYHIYQINEPMETAVKWDVPDATFDEIVKDHLTSINYPGLKQLGSKLGMSILADCAYQKKTNYIRILIENGAYVDQSIKELEGIGAADAISLLRKEQAEAMERSRGVK